MTSAPERKLAERVAAAYTAKYAASGYSPNFRNISVESRIYSIPAGTTLDADGGNRVVGSQVDIGAFEFGNAPRNKPPVIGISASTVNEGDKLVQNVGATDFENDPLSYTISGGAGTSNSS